jgi:hypothetical protein
MMFERNAEDEQTSRAIDGMLKSLLVESSTNHVQFPSGGFKYEIGDGIYDYPLHGQGPNPAAVANYPGSTAAIETNTFNYAGSVGGRLALRENLMRSGTWIPFSTDPNDAHIPLINSPF